MSGIFGVPVGAAYHLVFALTHLLTPVAGGLAAVTAIIVFTAVVRLLIAPLSLRALRGQAATARLAPQMQALRKRHAGQPERLQRELAELYQREGASPLGGFLPLLLQWPFLTVMYLLFRSATVDGSPNQLLSARLFGVPLGSHWLSGASLVSGHDAVFLGVFALLAGLCWLTARLARRMAPAPAAPASEVVPGAKAAGLLARVLPYLTVVFAAFVPLAAALYLLTTVAWTLGERRVFLRRTARSAAVPVPEGPAPSIQRRQRGQRPARPGSSRPAVTPPVTPGDQLG
jgi:YidC/Oxa1 family membrane protein insertase